VALAAALVIAVFVDARSMRAREREMVGTFLREQDAARGDAAREFGARAARGRGRAARHDRVREPGAAARCSR